MASRLRGMTNLSSTIIPRVQRLLETDVLKERPLWLDVVEAHPPLNPPVVPLARRTGKVRELEYKGDKQRRELEESIASATGRQMMQRQTLSLFETRSLKKIHRLESYDTEKEGKMKPSYSEHDAKDLETEGRMNVSETKEHEVKVLQTISESEREKDILEREEAMSVSEREKGVGLKASPLAAAVEKPEVAPPARKMEDEMDLLGTKGVSQFEDKIGELASVLKEYEDQKS